MSQPWTSDDERLARLMLTNRCCTAPDICGARCLENEQSLDLALLVAEIDKLRDAVRESQGEALAAGYVRKMEIPFAPIGGNESGDDR